MAIHFSRAARMAMSSKEYLLKVITDADPETLERYLLWFSSIDRAVDSPERFRRCLEWYQRGATLNLEDDEYQMVLDFVIVRRLGSDDPDSTRREEQNHDKVVNPD
jgi:hypothetical protein